MKRYIIGFLLLIIVLAFIVRAANESSYDDENNESASMTVLTELPVKAEETTEIIEPTAPKYIFDDENSQEKYKDSTTFIDALFEIPALRQDIPSQILRRKGYTVSYNKETKQPNWVAWHLTADHTDGEWARPSGNAFHEDMEVPAPRASNYDYKRSGWSRGHMCPAGDNRWDSTAMYESFLLTNVCPQHDRLNSGDWNDIEQECRKWAKKYEDLYIVCGPIFYRQEHEMIGANEIPVPEAFFKVVVCLNDKPKGIGFVCKNTEGNRKTDFYVNTIQQVERITGYQFFPLLPEDLVDDVKGKTSLREW